MARVFFIIRFSDGFQWRQRNKGMTPARAERLALLRLRSTTRPGLCWVVFSKTAATQQGLRRGFGGSRQIELREFSPFNSGSHSGCAVWRGPESILPAVVMIRAGLSGRPGMTIVKIGSLRTTSRRRGPQHLVGGAVGRCLLPGRTDRTAAPACGGRAPIRPEMEIHRALMPRVRLVEAMRWRR